jgi:hypothetical protein
VERNSSSVRNRIGRLDPLLDRVLARIGLNLQLMDLKEVLSKTRQKSDQTAAEMTTKFVVVGLSFHGLCPMMLPLDSACCFYRIVSQRYSASYGQPVIQEVFV